MGNEEKVGALIIALLMFSIVASLIPVGLKHKSEVRGSVWVPWLTKGSFIARGIQSNSISLFIDMGKVDIIGDPSAYEPRITLKGASPLIEGDVGRLIAGQITLRLPKRWNGSLSVKVGVGAIVLSDASAGSLDVEVGTGSIEGSIKLGKECRVNVDKGSARLTVYVPKDARINVSVKSLDGTVEYDGHRFEVKGNTLERTFGSGNEIIDLYVDAYGVDLNIVPLRG